MISDTKVNRRLNFEASSDPGSTSAGSRGRRCALIHELCCAWPVIRDYTHARLNPTGSGSSADTLDTQAWDVEPEDYVNSWLESQRAEDSAKVRQALAREKELKARAEHEAAAKRLEADLERCELGLGKPAACHDCHCSVI